MDPINDELECSPMARETRVQLQVESYQRHKNMALDTPLHYKIQIKGNMEQSRDRSTIIPYTSG